MAKQKAPEIIRVRASLAVYGLRKGQEETMPLTQIVQTLLADGKLVRIDGPEQGGLTFDDHGQPMLNGVPTGANPQIAAAAGRPMTDEEILAAGGEMDDGDSSL